MVKNDVDANILKLKLNLDRIEIDYISNMEANKNIVKIEPW